MRRATMTPRERVRAALHHQEPDRVPVDLAQAAGDGIVVGAYRNLLHYLGLGDRPIQVSSTFTQSVTVDEDVLRRFHVDFRGVEIGGPDGWKDIILPDDSYQDEWGVVRRRPPDGLYYDLVGSPLAEIDTISGLDTYHWPDPYNPGRFRGLREKAKRLRDETDYAIVLNVNCTFFLRCAELRGWENFYADLAGNKEFICTLMDRYLDWRLAVAERALEEAGEYADVVMCTSDDLAGSNELLISPKMYRELIKPRQQRTFDFFKARTDAVRLYHNDGAIYPLINDFIEIGVEALNPIQVSAAGMGDTKKLKAEFGDKLCFWGAIDTHHVLPHGSTEEVRQEVKRRIQDLGPGGGYVVCSVHNIQSDVPPENIVAMFDAVQEFGWYPLA